jgi:hypothetical protein
MFAATQIIPINAKNPEGAWHWMNFFCSPEGYDARGPTEAGRAARISRANSPRLLSQAWYGERGLIQAWKDSEASLHGPPQVVNYSKVVGEIGKGWAEVWSGQKTAKQVHEEITPAITGMLAS